MTGCGVGIWAARRRSRLTAGWKHTHEDRRWYVRRVFAREHTRLKRKRPVLAVIR
jgi:hypothetical protein